MVGWGVQTSAAGLSPSPSQAKPRAGPRHGTVPSVGKCTGFTVSDMNNDLVPCVEHKCTLMVSDMTDGLSAQRRRKVKAMQQLSGFFLPPFVFLLPLCF